MNFLNKFERKFSCFGIENLMLHISLINGFVYVLEYAFAYPMTSLLGLNPSLILSGQVWRLFTFVLIPPASSPIFILLTLYLYYWIGTSLESYWGKSKFTLYYLISMLGTIIASFVTGSFMTGIFINLSLFFAFASLYPDVELLLFFFIPVKIKYLAYLDAAWYLISFLIGSIATKFAIVASLIAFFIFFGKNFINNLKAYIRRIKYKNKWK